MEKRKRPPLGSYIYARRSALGLTQREAAEVAGTTAAYWAQIENGTVKLPGAVLRRGIAEALGVSHLDLLVAAGELTGEEAGYGALPPAPVLDPELVAMLVDLPRERLPLFRELLAMALSAAEPKVPQSADSDV